MSQPRKPGFVQPEELEGYLQRMEPVIAEVAAAIEMYGDDWLEMCSGRNTRETGL